jgi:hypothetical protein
MRVVFEKGKTGLWYATAENCEGLYRGLLVVGPTMDAVIDKLPDAFKDLRDAAAQRTPQENADAK